MHRELSIQQVAEQTGLSIYTLRYYERAGLLSSISRQPNGHRCYSERDLEWIDFLKCLRSTAMSIADMQEFATKTRQGDETLKARRELLEAHQEKLCQEMQAMQQAMDVIERKIAHYRVLEGQSEDDG